MTRTLTITADEWASAKDGRLWLVREGGCRKLPNPYDEVVAIPPAEFVLSCAPCETCHNTTGSNVQHGDFITGNFRLRWDLLTCPDCRIELVGPCQHCKGPGWGWCNECKSLGTVTLGHAYAVGQPLPIVLGWSRPDGDSSGDVLSFWKGHYGPDLVMQRAWNATAIQTQYADRTADLAHYGPPELLVGKWAIELDVTT